MTLLPAVVVLGPSALPLARRLQDALPNATIHGLAGRIEGADVVFEDTMAHLASLFTAGTPIVGVCAAGILIRAVAPHLADKHREPAVVAVAEDGSVAVPLVGGHHGANALARRIAAATGGTAAITTAGDVAFGLALDEPPPGWRIADPGPVKAMTAALLAGEPVKLIDELGCGGWLTASGIPFAEEAKRAIAVSDQRVKPMPNLVLYHPPVLALGVGCERDCSPSELIGLVEATLERYGLARGAVGGVFSIDLKMDEVAVHRVAEALGVPARFFDAPRLLAEKPRLSKPSDVVFRETGCYGVAEGAALAAVGPRGALVVTKHKSKRATCAVARAPAPFDAAAIGLPRGRLAIVGIGPGEADWRTPQASRALAEATDIVGYGLYLDILGPAIAGKTRHETGLGAETDRARRALDLAAEGKRVALVSSGDAGIYGLATLVFEQLDRHAHPAWHRVKVMVVPGLSALQAAAARAGAPLGHDFCAISLSDLLTPWPTIEQRLRAAAEGDFVVALYNPRSERRTDQLVRAREILLTGRPAATPVFLARNLGRPGEQHTVTTLGELQPEAVDMLTLVMIGSSQTRAVAGQPGRLYTPRGYVKKDQGLPT